MLLLNGKDKDAAGRSYNDYSIDELIDALQILPSGFTERTNIVPLASPEPLLVAETESNRLFRKLEEDLERLAPIEEGNTVSADSYDILSGQFTQAIDTALTEGNAHLAVMILTHQARFDRRMSVEQPLGSDLAFSSIQEAQERFERAISLTQEHDIKGELYSLYGELYNTLILHASAFVQSSQPVPDAIAKRLKKVRLHSFDECLTLEGRVDPNAWDIGQREMAFSAKEPIGTRGIGGCVVVALKSEGGNIPKGKAYTSKVGIWHADGYVTADSITKETKKRMPTQCNYKVRIVGADNFTQETKRKGLSRSLTVLKTLARGKQKVDIVSSDIGSETQPSAVVVDPVSFVLTEAVPAVPNPDRLLTLGSADRRTALIRTALDLTEIKQRAPILLERGQARRLTLPLDTSSVSADIELSADLQLKGFSVEQVPAIVEAIIQVADAILAVVAAMGEESKRYIESTMKYNVVKETRGHIVALNEAVTNCPMHIGQGATHANARLRALVGKRLFELKGDVLRPKMGLLKNFAVKSAPLDYMIHTAGEGRSR